MKYKDFECCLKYKKFKDDWIEYKSLYYNKNYQKMFNENLKNLIINTYKYSNHDINKFVLLPRKGIHPYE